MSSDHSACVFLEMAAQCLRCGDATKVQTALHNLFVLFERHFPFQDEDPIATSALSLGIALMKNMFATSRTTHRFLEFAFPAIDGLLKLFDIPTVLHSKDVATQFIAKVRDLRSKVHDLYPAAHGDGQMSTSSVKLEFFFKSKSLTCMFISEYLSLCSGFLCLQR